MEIELLEDPYTTWQKCEFCVEANTTLVILSNKSGRTEVFFCRECLRKLRDHLMKLDI